MKILKLITVFFLFSFSANSQSCCNALQNGMRALTQRVSDLEAKCMLLELKLCQAQVHFKIATSVYYYPEMNNEALYLNDRFPLPACNMEQGILITSDATIYCQYQDWNNGWSVLFATHGGYETN